MILGPLLQLRDVLFGGTVGSDCLLAIRGQLRLPVTLSVLVLLEEILLVLVIVLVICPISTWLMNGFNFVERKEGGGGVHTTRGFLYLTGGGYGKCSSQSWTGGDDGGSQGENWSDES